MAFITKNANTLLLLLIIISATTLVTATVYFQSNFERLNMLYNNKMALLENVSNALESRQASLARIEHELELKSARETDFTQKYSEIRETKDVLEKTAEQLKSENTVLQEDNAKKESALKKKDDEVKDRENKILNLQGAMNEIQRQYDEINFKYVKIKQDACTNYNATKYC